MPYDSPETEKSNPASAGLDKMTPLEIVTLINREDKKVAVAVEAVLDRVALAVEKIAEALKNGGRLIYIGAGTSGRLGILDASECPPTFGVSPDMVVGLIAGGRESAFRATENAEDDYDAGARDLTGIGFTSRDVCFGISAGGGAEYVVGALDYAKSLGALTVALCCNPDSKISRAAELAITPVVGPEIIGGSTRMKAGTAQKLVLNMISTGVMIRLGRVDGNRMTHMRPSNKKLRERAVRIIAEELADAGIRPAEEEIREKLAENDGDIEKTVQFFKIS